MPSSMLEKAEIMYAAPPQYHVKGAVINLIIRKNYFENLYGQVNATYFQIYHSGKDMSELNTQSRQDEYTCDVYAGFSKKFSGHFSLSASLTGEYYHLNDYREWTFFPTLSSTYIYRPEHQNLL
jgi:hypothetical protein